MGSGSNVTLFYNSRFESYRVFNLGTNKANVLLNQIYKERMAWLYAINSSRDPSAFIFVKITKWFQKVGSESGKWEDLELEE